MKAIPPTGPESSGLHWGKIPTFRFRHILKYAIGLVLHGMTRVLNVHPRAVKILRHALELSNPTNSLWPNETTPMVSRLLSGGVWNYSFFQFHRSYFFPYWALKQYDPSSRSFIPRSHNVMSINQTQRNWVAISFPGKKFETSVDMAGGVMPGLDRFTIEMAIYENGKILRPHDNEDMLEIRKPNPSELQLLWKGRKLILRSEQFGLRLLGEGAGDLILSIRPFNMEGGVQIYRLQYFRDVAKIAGTDIQIAVRNKPDMAVVNGFQHGDALHSIGRRIEQGNATEEKKRALANLFSRSAERFEARDRIGLVTGAFYYSSVSAIDWYVRDNDPPISRSLVRGLLAGPDGSYSADKVWEHWFPNLMTMKLPGEFGEWYSTSRDHILSLWDFDTITPGSFTYHNFWIRDAVIVLNSLLFMGGIMPVQRILLKAAKMVSSRGLFKSQAGEWDANGQALWIIGRYVAVSGDDYMITRLRSQIRRMVRWIERTINEHGGVLPPGFSAEHLGVADWYLWDNFWALGGLRALFPWEKNLGVDLERIYKKLFESLQKYLQGYDYYPAALGRAKDAGMIGSVAAVYPLGLPEFNDPRMLQTLHTIKDKYFYEGGFFQENIHSGVNPYLTLQVAEGFLATGESATAMEILKRLRQWRSKAYSFPEAVHPRSRGGTMGDGFHGWAFAEVISLLKNMFFLEYTTGYLLFAGVPPEWFSQEAVIENLYTPSGRLYLEIQPGSILVSGIRKLGRSICFLALPENLQVMTTENTIRNADWTALDIEPHKGRVLYAALPENGRIYIRFRLKQ